MCISIRIYFTSTCSLENEINGAAIVVIVKVGVKRLRLLPTPKYNIDMVFTLIGKMSENHQMI